jgi:hypothetical protein
MTSSLDRKDSSIGYTKDNIRWVLKDINMMKQQFSEDRFLELCHQVSAGDEYKSVETPIDIFIRNNK